MDNDKTPVEYKTLRAAGLSQIKGLHKYEGKELFLLDTVGENNFEVKSIESNEDSPFLTIKGYASTYEKDSYGDVIPIETWQKSETLKRYKSNPIVYGDHRTWDSSNAIGVCTTIEITDKGLYVEANIKKTASIAENVSLGIVKSLSIGFLLKNYTYDEKKKIYILTDIELYEISVCGIPSNPTTTFDLAKKFKSMNNDTHHKENNTSFIGKVKTFLGLEPKKTEEELIFEQVEKNFKDLDVANQTIESLKGANEANAVEIGQLKAKVATLESEVTTLRTEKDALVVSLEQKSEEVTRLKSKATNVNGHGTDPDIEDRAKTPLELKLEHDKQYAGE